MNDIVYAGKDAARAAELASTRKYWQFIRCGGRGEAKCEKGGASYARGDILVVPPLTACTRVERGDDGYIFMEGTALPFRSLQTVKEEKGGGFAHAFLQAERYFGEGSERSSAVLSALGDLIVSYIVAQTERQALSPVVESLCADIAANVSNSSYALDAVIRALPLNYDYVRKLFKSQTGATPHEYLTSLRMHLARQLLLSGMSNQYSRYSVAQISEMCGFAEPLYFSRVFKKHFGAAPSDYGRQPDALT